MKPYIDLNTKMRKLAKDEFSKDFYKLMNNSVFGKTIENVRKRVDMNFIKTDTELRKLTSKPNFKNMKIYSKDLLACLMQKESVLLDKSIYIGMSVLDISKTLMYGFHYEAIKQRYKDKAKLLFTNTDSLCYFIETADLENDRLEEIHKYDTSNYPQDHKLYSEENIKIIGKMKDETCGSQIEEFVGLKAKLYSFRTHANLVKRAKGVKKSVIQKTIKMEEFKQVLFGEEQVHKTMNLIQSKNHILYTNEVNKIAFKCGR